jgi:hypothetical protein
MKPNPDKPEKKKIFYHEITKVRNHEKDRENLRVFCRNEIQSFCGFPPQFVTPLMRDGNDNFGVFNYRSKPKNQTGQ